MEKEVKGCVWVKASEKFPSMDNVCRKIGTVEILDSYDLLQASKRGYYSSSYYGKSMDFNIQEWEWLDESQSPLPADSESPVQKEEARDWVKRYEELRRELNMNDSINKLVEEVKQHKG